MSDIEDLMAGLDRPVTLPDDLRTRLRAQLTDSDQEPLLVGLDAPHALKDAQRERLAAALSAGVHVPRPRPAQRWLALAAALVLIAGTTFALQQGAFQHGGGQDGGRSRVEAALPHPASTLGGARQPAQSPTAALGASSQATAAGSEAGAAGFGAGGSGGASAQPEEATAGAASTAGSAPPYAFGPTPAASSASSPNPGGPPAAPNSGPNTAPKTTPAAIVTVVAGDHAEQAGFDAYVALLDRSDSRHIATVATADSRAVATVNLSDAPLASTTAGPVLETMPVPEPELHSPVFDAASAPAHQGAVAVAVMFPNASTGRIATIYRGAQGVWATDVPNAMSAALQRRGVTAVVMPYSAGQFRPGPGDAALLALDTSDAKSWFADAGRAGYRPALGVIGISSLVDSSLLASLPEGTRAVGAYDLPGSDEQAALAAALGHQPGMAEVHGWVSAKLLAVALWRSGATTRAQTTRALGGLVGYDDGFNPAIAYRAGTTSRTPDGVVFTVRERAFVTTHTFQSDPG